jgi:acyl-CoA synthetase (AMP-forming)/AMP-acid ligase II
MPLYHIGAKNLWLMNSAMGATILLHRAFRPAEFYASLNEQYATTTLLAPTMLSDLIEQTPASGTTLPNLKRIMYSAAPMPEPLLRKALAAFGPIFVQVYGMTESGGPGCILHANHHDPDGPPSLSRRLRSAGQPMAQTDVRVLRPDGSFANDDEAGVIAIRGPAIMTGYWNNHAATSDALVDGWLRTGDAGHCDEDGFIYLVDRIKDMIVSGGENIYSREVENALLSHPAILECAVVGAPHPRWGEQIVAFVVCRPGMSISAPDAIAHCRTQIASYKRPQQVHVVEGLPKLPNGKIEKYKLRAGLAHQAEQAAR